MHYSSINLLIKDGFDHIFDIIRRIVYVGDDQNLEVIQIWINCVYRTCRDLGPVKNMEDCCAP